jgi:hypothetical protein
MRRLIPFIILLAFSWTYSSADIPAPPKKYNKIQVNILNPEDWPDHYLLYADTKNGRPDTIKPGETIVFSNNLPVTSGFYLWATSNDGMEVTKKEFIPFDKEKILNIKIDYISEKELRYTLKKSNSKGYLNKIDPVPMGSQLGLGGTSLTAALLIGILFSIKRKRAQ